MTPLWTVFSKWPTVREYSYQPREEESDQGTVARHDVGRAVHKLAIGSNVDLQAGSGNVTIVVLELTHVHLRGGAWGCRRRRCCRRRGGGVCGWRGAVDLRGGHGQEREESDSERLEHFREWSVSEGGAARCLVQQLPGGNGVGRPRARELQNL